MGGWNPLFFLELFQRIRSNSMKRKLSDKIFLPVSFPMIITWLNMGFGELIKLPLSQTTIRSQALVAGKAIGDTGFMIHIQSLIDDAKCFETIRNLRWPDGVRCPHCTRPVIIKQGRDDTQPERQRYLCQSCSRRFDDLTHTIFAGHHQPLRNWILCLYFMGLNLSNAQIAKELDLNKDDVHQMTAQLRQGIVSKTASPTFTDEVECDEVYIVAGHKGQPEEVVKKGAVGAVDASKTNVDVELFRVRSRRFSG